MTRLKLIFVILFVNIFIVCDSASTLDAKNVDEECNLSQDIINDIAGYAPRVKLIMDYFLEGPFKGETYKRISEFVDKFGSRVSGSKSLEDSINYMAEQSIQNNLEHVFLPEVEVPNWVRGEESATLLEPRVKNLPMLGLGKSISTPPEGITAQVVVVRSFDELDALSMSDVNGKIVVYNQPFTTYRGTVGYRARGATEAAKKGAVAALIRSVAPFSIASPHTGDQSYAPDVTKIPVAAITSEDANLLWRKQQRGERLVVNLKMSNTENTTISRNFISDYKGSEMEEKIVLISGHIDSWDVGDGSMDDAGGCFISWMAPIALKKLGLRPKRTLRTMFFTAEEFGYIGAEAYAEHTKANNDNLNFVMESDFGTFAPLGLIYQGSKPGECMMREILKLFERINATELVLDTPGSDITVWTDQGIPGGGLHNDDKDYFWFHHAEGDALNVLNSDVMDANSAFWTSVSYIIADMKYDIPRSVAGYHSSLFLVIFSCIFMLIKQLYDDFTN